MGGDHTGAEYSRCGLTKALEALDFAVFDERGFSSEEIQDLSGFCMVCYDPTSVQGI